jgi:hypothetical protein
MLFARSDTCIKSNQRPQQPDPREGNKEQRWEDRPNRNLSYPGGLSAQSERRSPWPMLRHAQTTVEYGYTANLLSSLSHHFRPPTESGR